MGDAVDGDPHPGAIRTAIPSANHPVTVPVLPLTTTDSTAPLASGGAAGVLSSVDGAPDEPDDVTGGGPDGLGGVLCGALFCGALFSAGSSAQLSR